MTQARFPDASSAEAFDALACDETLLRPGVTAICEQLGVNPAQLQRFPDGSLPVYAAGASRVLKIYPPLYRAECDRERLVLDVVHQRLPIPTPALEAWGELEGWTYLLMSRLPGTVLSQAWPAIEPEQRLSLMGAAGRALRAFHSLQDVRLAALDGDWAGFVRQQRATAVARQRARGLETHWLEQIPRFLDSVPLRLGGETALLHTEVMREHLMVAGNAGVWKLSGLIDFEPAMRGDPEYEFASVGVFLSQADATSFQTLLEAYGYTAAQMDEGFQRRCLAHALLHRYSNLPLFLRRVPPPPDVRTLERLARHWWRLP